MTTLILIVATILIATAVTAGVLLSRRLRGAGPAGGWTAGRRCRREAALAARLGTHDIDRAAYRDAMSALAALDEQRFPLAIPKQPQD
ncbi:hypothetical protein Val02_49810 [Virgisporangium aliadipatigenens]|uniref:Uncharacterized protein n=1 Tax=Virgisporangium aliadipatigenens TaxID=741659 RepID=A0A8J3YQG5_9ACTN|nr:hypothetical protein [Virgisporangium aliadipatigenens]GIJ48095.1 hypothetical protein Val02_49810 [Virgisporangium aliadipatigenens]